MKPSAIHNNVGQCTNLIQLIYLTLFLQVQLTGVLGDGPTTLSNASSRDASRNITRILNEFFSSGYDKRVRPNYGGAPVEVGISMFIISISTVSEVKMDFTSDFYFRQGWNDPRLSFEKQDMISNLFVGAEVAKKIWVPDTFFANEKQAYFHTATTPNRFLRISSDGDVFQSIRLTVTASCPMDLQYFPMDRQSCSIEIESYGYSMADIRYTWSKGKDSVGLSKGLELPQFKVVGHKQEQKEVTLSTGNYSRLICDIQFARSLGFYLIQIYIPASLIVVISWVSFWLHRNATPARVALGVTTVLTMTTLMSSTNAQLPKISYIKSIDVFLGTCFVMVFGSLLEYAVVGYLGKRISMRKTTAENMNKQNDEHRKRCVAAQAATNACVQDPNQMITDSGGTQQIANQLHHQTSQSQQMPNQLQPQMTHLHVHSQPMQAIQHPQTIQPNQLCTQICQTTGLPLDPIQMACPLKTPQMNTSAMNSLNTMNSMGMNRCTGTQSKIIYGPANYRVLDPSTQLQSQVHQAQNPHQLPTQAITKITNTKSDHTDLPQMNKDASDNQPNLSLSQQPSQDHTENQQPPIMAISYPKRNLNKMLGMSPSDIDKYSRVVFPVCFVCFNLMYWVIYMHISDVKITDLVPLKS